jgi:hypothetical protein
LLRVREEGLVPAARLGKIVDPLRATIYHRDDYLALHSQQEEHVCTWIKIW